MTRINTHFVVALFCFFFLFCLQGMSQASLTYCQPSDLVSQNSSYLTNRNTVLNTLRNRSSFGSYYSNATAGLGQNTVYGMFFCRGNLDKTFCYDCVKSTISHIYKDCFYRKEALVLSSECIVRYSNISFFTIVEDLPNSASYSPGIYEDSPQISNRTLLEKLEELILREPLFPTSLPVPYFVENQERVIQLEGSYDVRALVQCSPDLVPSNCTVCLRLAVQELSECCSHAQEVEIILPKCLIIYNISALPQANHGFTKGKEIFGIAFIGIMTTLVLRLMGL